MVLLLLSDCGVPQEDYDAVVAIKDAAEAKSASLEGELDEAESQIAVLESDVATIESALTAAESDLARAETRISSLKSSLGEMQSQTSSLASDLATAESAVAEEEVRILELEAQIAELEVEKANLEAQLEVATEEEAEGESESPYKLLLISERVSYEYGHIGVRGEVKNISDESLSYVQVVIDIYNVGVPDFSARALIRKTLLLPGETSEFEVFATVTESGGQTGKGIKRIYFKFRDPHIIPHTTE